MPIVLRLNFNWAALTGNLRLKSLETVYPDVGRSIVSPHFSKRSSIWLVKGGVLDQSLDSSICWNFINAFLLDVDISGLNVSRK
jgi:hypothetical protein